MKILLKQIRPALVCFLAMTVICGILYTGLVTGIAKLFFPAKASGSIITVTLKDGTTKQYGSALLAQEFSEPKYIIGRPMGTTNLSPTSAEQKKLVEQRIAWWRRFDPQSTAAIPIDLVTASGSGVDPHISPEAAQFQAVRIARVRGISEDKVKDIIEKYTTGRFLGFIGEPCVNVLQVNLALDGLI